MARRLRIKSRNVRVTEPGNIVRSEECWHVPRSFALPCMPKWEEPECWPVQGFSFRVSTIMTQLHVHHGKDWNWRPRALWSFRAVLSHRGTSGWHRCAPLTIVSRREPLHPKKRASRLAERRLACSEFFSLTLMPPGIQMNPNHPLTIRIIIPFLNNISAIIR